MTLNPLDVAFTLLLVLVTLRAGFRGFVREFMAVAAIVLGIGAATLFSAVVTVWIDQILGVSIWNHVIAYLGLFLIVYLIVKLAEGALNVLIERIHLDGLDHALGLFFGCVEALLVIFLLILIMQVQPFFSFTEILSTSLYTELLNPLIPYAGSLM